MQSKKISKY